MVDRPSPIEEVARLSYLKPAIRRRLTALSVWCETGTCCVARVYRLRSGDLLHVLGQAFLGREEDEHLWAGRGGGWLDELEEDELELPIPFSCNCQHMTDRTAGLTYARVFDALRNGTPNIGVVGASRHG